MKYIEVYLVMCLCLLMFIVFWMNCAGVYSIVDQIEKVKFVDEDEQWNNLTYEEEHLFLLSILKGK